MVFILKTNLQPIGVKLFLQINKISILSSKHWVCFMASNHLKHLSLYMASNHFRESGFRHSFLTSHKLINLHDNSLTASCRFLHYLIEESHSFSDQNSMFLHGYRTSNNRISIATWKSFEYSVLLEALVKSSKRCLFFKATSKFLKE